MLELVDALGKICLPSSYAEKSSAREALSSSTARRKLQASAWLLLDASSENTSMPPYNTFGSAFFCFQFPPTTDPGTVSQYPTGDCRPTLAKIR